MAHRLKDAEYEPRKMLQLLGVSFRTAPIAVRESLSFSQEEAKELLASFANDTPNVGLMLLSTCNRTEFYIASTDKEHAQRRLLETLKALRPEASIFHSDCNLYQKDDAGAVEHLFQVASGLDSAILGDGQILGQVKTAMQLAAEMGTLNSGLNQTLAQTMRVAKRSRNETNIANGNAGIGSAIAGLLNQREQELACDQVSRRFLIIGAGQIAREIGRSLSKQTRHEIVFINRNRTRAESLAEHCGSRVESWDNLSHSINEADFIVAATASKTPIVTNKMASGLDNKRKRLFIDAGVPRNIEPLSGHELINLDSIRALQEKTLSSRISSIPHVQSIVRDEVDKWIRNQNSIPIERMLKFLFLESKSICQGIASAHLDSTTRNPEEIEHQLGRNLENMLFRHARELRQWAEYGKEDLVANEV